jgi:ATP-dependent DNA helicase RecG
LIPDGTWTANLFQFYQRVILRLTRDLKVPFRLEPDLLRIDDTLVHEAMREALTNALIHADYQGIGGIVIERYRNRIELSNPGSLLISYEQLLHGGVSECRNRCLQQMFQMIGRGEKAGSGIDKIRQGWNSQNWRSPEIEEIFQPDRVLMILPLESFLPEASLERLRALFGRRIDTLGPMEIQTLVTAEAEGKVSNARMRMVSNEHAADLTRMFQGLVLKGFLEQVGQKRGAFYRLPPFVQNFPHKADSPHNGQKDSPHKEIDSAIGEDPLLIQIAAPARTSQRLQPAQTRRIILDLCADRFLTPAQIGALMDRKADRLQERFLAPMAREGLLQMRFPQERNRPDQAYRTRTS